MKSVTSLLAAAAGLGAVFVSAQAGCNAIKDLVVTLPEVYNCYKSFPADANYKNQHVANVKKFLAQYPFIDLNRGPVSNNPNLKLFSMSVDVMGELDRIAATAANDFELHARITLLILSLNDGHLTYTSNCFTQFFFSQPWVLAPVYGASGRPSIRITQEVTQGSWYQPYEAAFPAGKKPADYVGWTVRSIDGMDAVDAILAFGNRLSGFAREPDTQFNFIVPAVSYSDGNWAVNQGSFGNTQFLGYDASPTRQYVLVDPANAANIVTINVPWISFKPEFTDGEDYKKRYCVGAATKADDRARYVDPAYKVGVSSVSNTTVTVYGGGFMPNSPQAVIAKVDSTDELRRTSIGADAAALAGQVARDIVAVVGNGSDPTASARVVNLSRRGITVLGRAVNGSATTTARPTGTSKPSTRKVVTVVNGGGAVSVANTGAGDPILDKPLTKHQITAFYQLDDEFKTGVWALASMAPTEVNGQTREQALAAWFGAVAGGLIALENAGSKKLVIDTTGNGGGYACAGYAFSLFLFPNAPRAFRDHHNLRLNPTVQSYIKAGFHQFVSFAKDGDSLQGPTTRLSRNGGKTTEDFTPPFFANCDGFMGDVPKLKTGWDPKDVVVLSSGYCGSTCSIFVRRLRELVGVRVITYGGASGRPYTPYSFEGGWVKQFDEITAEKLAAANPDMFNSLTPVERDALPKAFTIPVSGGSITTEALGSGLTPAGFVYPVEWVVNPAEAHINVAGNVECREDREWHAGDFVAAAAGPSAVAVSRASACSVAAAATPR
ncbi:hypothetical protein HDU96_005299 [Phlyctochytrium bullatum]|nr:hypothetical protein HDU96_005299 [Phlyctochytrium bullatum]